MSIARWMVTLLRGLALTVRRLADGALTRLGEVHTRDGEPAEDGGPPAHWVERVSRTAPHLLKPGPMMRAGSAAPRRRSDRPTLLERDPEQPTEQPPTPTVRAEDPTTRTVTDDARDPSTRPRPNVVIEETIHHRKARRSLPVFVRQGETERRASQLPPASAPPVAPASPVNNRTSPAADPPSCTSAHPLESAAMPAWPTTRRPSHPPAMPTNQQDASVGAMPAAPAVDVRNDAEHTAGRRMLLARANGARVDTQRAEQPAERTAATPWPPLAPMGTRPASVGGSAGRQVHRPTADERIAWLLREAEAVRHDPAVEPTTRYPKTPVPDADGQPGLQWAEDARASACAEGPSAGDGREPERRAARDAYSNAEIDEAGAWPTLPLVTEPEEINDVVAGQLLEAQRAAELRREQEGTAWNG